MTTTGQVAAWGRGLFVLRGTGNPEEVRGAVVSDNHFSMLGAKPQLGRGFLPDEGIGNNAQVVVLSHGLWKRSFSGDPGIIGQAVAFDGGLP